MPDRAAIIRFLDDLLDARGWPDLGPNGLQVPGREQVNRVVCGVSAHRELIERAIALHADLLLVHHGIFWDFHPRALSVAMAERLKLLLSAGLNLAQYHLPLDGCSTHGNNALIADALGCDHHEAFAEYKGRMIGRIGSFGQEGIEPAELFTRVETICEREPLVFASGPDRIRRIGIVSGAASKNLQEAIDAGCDAFLTGEPAEHVMADAKEGAIHFIAAGHYATERFGVRRLGELLAAEFGIEHSFVDIPNPV